MLKLTPVAERRNGTSATGPQMRHVLNWTILVRRLEAFSCIMYWVLYLLFINVFILYFYLYLSGNDQCIIRIKNTIKQ